MNHFNLNSNPTSTETPWSESPQTQTALPSSPSPKRRRNRVKIFLSVIVSILAISGLISAVILVRLNADVRKSAHSNESAGMVCTEEDWGYRESACVNGKSTRTYQKLTACTGGVTKPAQQEAQCNTYTSIPQVTASIYPTQENYPYRGFGLNIYTLDLATVFDNRNTPQGEHNYQEMVEGVKKTGAKQIRVPNGCHVGWYDMLQQDNSPHPEPSMEEIFTFADDTDTDILMLLPVARFFVNNNQFTYRNNCRTSEFIVNLDEQNLREFVRQYTVERKQQGKRYISLYELGNEDWGVMRKPKGASDDQYQYITRNDYVQAANRMAKIIREEAGDDVTIIGVSIDNRQHKNPSSLASELVFGQDAYKYMERTNQLEIDLVNYHMYWADWFWNGSSNVTKISANERDGLSLLSLDPVNPPSPWGYMSHLIQYRNGFSDVAKQLQKPAITEWNYGCWKGENYDLAYNLHTFEHGMYALNFLMMSYQYNIPYTFWHMYTTGETRIDQNCSPTYNADLKNFDIELRPAGQAMDIMSRFAGDTHTRLVLNGVPTIQVKKSGPQYQSIVGLSGKSGNTQYLILLNKDTNRSVGVKIPVESLGLGSKVKYDKYYFSSSAWNTPSASFSKVVENRIEETGVIHNTSVPFRSAVVFVIEPYSDTPIPQPTPSSPPATPSPVPSEVPSPSVSPTPQPFWYDLNRCWNDVGSVNGSYHWPNTCRGVRGEGLICGQAFTPLSANEVTQYTAWVEAGRPDLPVCSQ